MPVLTEHLKNEKKKEMIGKYSVDANILIKYILSKDNGVFLKLTDFSLHNELFVFDKTISEIADVLYGKKYFCKTKKD
ncbi:hypothetical protein FACS189459_0040 [Bacilli bacterium]|nr:hypothetical protein FACS189459_0040 [Bacilli bacterium]